jgi:hypothetical protein
MQTHLGVFDVEVAKEMLGLCFWLVLGLFLACSWLGVCSVQGSRFGVFLEWIFEYF